MKQRTRSIRFASLPPPRPSFFLLLSVLVDETAMIPIWGRSTNTLRSFRLSRWAWNAIPFTSSILLHHRPSSQPQQRKMCLLVWYWDRESSPSFVLAANRDEFLDRPSRSARYWNNVDDDNHPKIYGGRDLEMGGTWLACSNHGRFAAVTNYHETTPSAHLHDSLASSSSSATTRNPKSRGEIPVLFLHESSSLSAMEFATTILQMSHREYGGYNALLFDGTSLVYCSNRGETQTEEKTITKEDGAYTFVSYELSKGFYGMSNHLLDTPWPKLERAKQALSEIVTSELSQPISSLLPPPSPVSSDTQGNGSTHHNPPLSCPPLFEKLLALMKDNHVLSEDTSRLPQTMEDWEEHVRTAIYLDSPTFGTRTTTIVTFEVDRPGDDGGGGGFRIVEQNHKTRLPSSEASYSQQHIPCTIPPQRTKWATKS